MKPGFVSLMRTDKRHLVWILAFCILHLAFLTRPSAQLSSDADGIPLLLDRLEKVLQSGDRDQLLIVLSPLVMPPQIERLQRELFVVNTVRAVVRERDRAPLQGALPGDGFRLTVEIFTETPRRARIVTTRIDVRRPRDGDSASWRLVGGERLTLIEGLHRLRLDAATQLAARNFTIESEDLLLTLANGSVFRVDSEDGLTGLVLLGRGEMRFSPAPGTEKTQLRIFAGSETLVAPFDAAFIRINPVDSQARVATDALRPMAVEPQTLRRAQEVFAREAQKSLNLDLRDMSRDMWHLVPPAGDFLAEVRTRRHGTLTYGRTRSEPEDITLFDRTRRRTIAIYPSAERLAARGPFYNEDDLTDYDIVDYDIDATITPQREFLAARTRLTLRSRIDGLATLTLHLAQSLNIKEMFSVELGRLLYLRVRNGNSVIVTLPVALVQNQELTIVVEYSGTVTTQKVDTEGLALSAQRGSDTYPNLSEPHLLLSNRSYWYPQGEASDYATATMRVTVPEGYGCLASGELAAGSPTALRDPAAGQTRSRQYVFTATDPPRYLAVVVSRFSQAGQATVRLGSEGEEAKASAFAGATADRSVDTSAISASGERLPGFRIRDRVDITVLANPRQQGSGRERLEWAQDIMRFYAALMEDTPYAALGVALVEDDLPGGHSPAYFAMLNNPPPQGQNSWRNDPAAFSGYDEFFLAHELAHQWWGQAVGWKNYHEQWLSESFAQYFSALYAQRAYGDDRFTDMLRQFRRWAISESEEGPVYLGYRLGHIKGDNRVFRALVYNKGAAVLHMLRRLLGDDVFFNGLRRFYNERKFQKAGTDDLQRALEAESRRSLARFFERWIYGSDLPRLRYQTLVEPGGVTVRFEQRGEFVFDVPVTVTITYVDGRTQDIVVPIADKLAEQKIATTGAVRQVQVNRDSAALAQFDES